MQLLTMFQGSLFIGTVYAGVHSSIEPSYFSLFLQHINDLLVNKHSIFSCHVCINIDKKSA